MAEKEEPKPKLYNPLHDKSIDDVLKDYHAIFTPEEQKKYRVERTSDRDVLYGRMVSRLADHGVDETTGNLAVRGFKDLKDKKKWAEDLVHRLALHGVAKHFGPDAVKVYGNPDNHDLLRKYVEEHMVTKEIGSYDNLIDLFADSEDLLSDFHEDGPIRKVIDTYLDSINSSTRKEQMFVQHIAKPEHYEAIHKFTEGKLKDHKLRVKKGTGIEALLRTLQFTAQPEKHPVLRHLKHLEEIKEEKKK